MIRPGSLEALCKTAACVAALLFAWNAAGSGSLSIDITDGLARPLPARVDLVSRDTAQAPIRIPVPEGLARTDCPPGSYQAFIYAYEFGIPILVEIREIAVQEGERALLPANVLQGFGADGKTLREFDADGDLVLDSVETTHGTDEKDPASFPGSKPVEWEDHVLSDEGRWYRGDLHVRSEHGGGTESVKELVRRAEKSGLDFIAITDRNTMAACQEESFSSQKVVLIPAMEWGNNERGVALIYGPRTLPEQPEDPADAQAVVYRVQAQGGIFAIAHPCFPTAPWQWGLSYVNAVEVWCRDWRAVPPITRQALGREYARRNEDGRFVYSMSVAANQPYSSANRQAVVFWEEELKRGLRAAPIAGSLSSSKKVPLGYPSTYVWAEQKSIAGILEGLWTGRTFVCRGPNGPQVEIVADVLKDGKVDVLMGGLVPAGVDTEFRVTVVGALDKKVRVLCNGLPIFTQFIDGERFVLRFDRKPFPGDVYQAQVIESPDEKEKEGFGPLEVLAISGALVAREIIVLKKGMDPTDMWIQLKNKDAAPLYIDQGQAQQGRVRVRADQIPLQSPIEGEFKPPEGAEVRELHPERIKGQ